MAFDKTARDLSWPKGTPYGNLANDLYGRMKAMAASGYSDARVSCEAGVEKNDDGITISLNMEGYFGVTCKDAMDCVRLRAPRLLPLFEKAYSLFSAIFLNGKDLQIQASNFFSDVIEPELTDGNYYDEEEAKSLAERYAAIKGLQYPEGLFYGCRGGVGKRLFKGVGLEAGAERRRSGYHQRHAVSRRSPFTLQARHGGDVP